MESANQKKVASYFLIIRKYSTQITSDYAQIFENISKITTKMCIDFLTNAH